MRFIYDLVPDLRGVVLAARGVLDPGNRLRELAFPVREVEDVRYRLTQVQSVDTAGAVRAFGTPSRQIRRPGITELKGGLPAVSAIDTVTEGELYRARQLTGADVGDALEAEVIASAARVAIAVDNRFEILRGAVLSTGALSIDNGEVIQSASFGVPTANLPAAPVAWTDAAAVPLTNLMAWMDVYVASAGAEPGVILTSRRILGLLLRNAEIRGILAANGVTPSIASQGSLSNVLAAYGLPPITTYERQIDGARVIPDNRLIFLPADDARLGATVLGITEQAKQLTQARVLSAAETPGVTVATLIEDHPVARHVNADSIGLPVLEQPNRLLAATVAA